MKQEDAEVLSLCEKWLRLDPGSIEGRLLRISCLLRKTDLRAAEAEFSTIERLNPSNLAEIRVWFQKEKAPK